MEASPPLITKAGPRSWHTARPSDLVATLARRPDLHEWRPSTAADVRRGELWRAYHKWPGVRARVPSSGLIVSTDGWVRTTGDEPGRCAALLDELAKASQPVEQLSLEGVC